MKGRTSRYLPGHGPRDKTNRKYRAAWNAKRNQVISSELRKRISAAASRNHGNCSNRISAVEQILKDAIDQRVFKYAGLEGRKHKTPISADFVAPRLKLIVQVDGCYWHECPKHGSKRFPDKRRRDRRLTLIAEKAGWTVLRFWEHDILKNLNTVTETINRTCRKLRKS